MKVPTLLADISSLVKNDQTQVAVRLAVVTSYIYPSVNVGVKIGGSTTEVIARFMNYKPNVGDTVQVIQDGLDPIVIGKVGSTGSGLSIPVGLIAMWGNSTPDDWERCEGQSTAGNQPLADVWGANVPDLRYKFVRGAGPGVPNGTQGGVDTVTLSANNLPSHSHPLNTVARYTTNTTHSHSSNPGTVAEGPSPQDGNSNPAATTLSTGFGQAFDAKPPFYVVTFIVKVA